MVVEHVVGLVLWGLLGEMLRELWKRKGHVTTWSIFTTNFGLECHRKLRIELISHVLVYLKINRSYPWQYCEKMKTHYSLWGNTQEDQEWEFGFQLTINLWCDRAHYLGLLAYDILCRISTNRLLISHKISEPLKAQGCTSLGLPSESGAGMRWRNFPHLSRVAAGPWLA